MLLLSTNLLKNTEQCYLCIKSLMYIYYVSVTLELYCCPKTKLKHISEPHWMTSSFNAKNMNTIYSIYIFFESVSHTCPEAANTIKVEMCINPQLKIVPTKWPIYSYLSNVCLKLQWPAVFRYHNRVHPSRGPPKTKFSPPGRPCYVA